MDLDIGEAMDPIVPVFEGQADDVTLTCYDSAPAVDYVVRFTAPADAVYRFGFEWNTDQKISIGILDGDCDGLQLACTQADFGSQWEGWGPGTHATVALTQGQSVLVVMQSTDPALGPTLEIESVLAGADESCVEADLGSAVGAPVTSGDLTLADLDLPAPCNNQQVKVADDVYAWVAPETGTYVVSAFESADTVLGVRPPGCTAEATLACAFAPHVHGEGPGLNGGAMLSVDLVAGQEVTIAVEGRTDGVIYDLDITANSTPGGTCCTASSAGIGCSEDGIEACVCDADSFCCADNWDIFCANRARQFCDAKCIGE